MGEPFVITDPLEARGEATRFRKMISAPVLTNVKAGFEGIETFSPIPETLPDVLAGRPIVFFGKWDETSGPKRLTITGSLAGSTFRQVLPIPEKGEADSDRYPALRRLWARQLIAELSDQEALVGSDDALRERITDLGLKYSLLTQYTSFFAVDHEVRNTDLANTTSVNQPQPLPQGVSNHAVGGVFVPGSPEPQSLGALLVTRSMMAMIARRLSRQRRRHWTL